MEQAASVLSSATGRDKTLAMIDSSSVGNPDQFRTLAELEAGLAALPESPKDTGLVVLLLRKGDGGVRETPDRIHASVDHGFSGDAWGRRADRKPEAQLAVMQRDVAELIANGQPLTLFGDNLILELDLSAANLPIGSRLRAGDAVFEVTPMPHNGCGKFQKRFGEDARAFVSKPELRHRNLRGIYLRVVEEGEVRVNEFVEVISRPPAV
jgi:MOSC domain-containing protein YiiM